MTDACAGIQASPTYRFTADRCTNLVEVDENGCASKVTSLVGIHMQRRAVAFCALVRCGRARMSHTERLFIRMDWDAGDGCAALFDGLDDIIVRWRR